MNKGSHGSCVLVGETRQAQIFKSVVTEWAGIRMKTAPWGRHWGGPCLDWWGLDFRMLRQEVTSWEEASLLKRSSNGGHGQPITWEMAEVLRWSLG